MKSLFHTAPILTAVNALEHGLPSLNPVTMLLVGQQRREMQAGLPGISATAANDIARGHELSRLEPLVGEQVGVEL